MSEISLTDFITTANPHQIAFSGFVPVRACVCVWVFVYMYDGLCLTHGKIHILSVHCEIKIKLALLGWHHGLLGVCMR